MIDIGLYDYAEDIDLPKRSDYNEIKTFQDYELTQCIVYELAIRNTRYKEEVDYVMEFYSKYKKEIDSPAKIHSLIKIQGTETLKSIGGHHPKFKELKRMIANIEVIPFNPENNVLEYKDVKRFGENFYELLDFIIKSQLKKDHNPTMKDKKKIVDKIDILKEEGFWIETKIESVIYPLFMIIEPSHEPETDTDPIPSLENFFLTAKTYNEDIASNNVARRLRRMNVLSSKIRIHEKFKRPKLKLDNGTTKHVIAEIDLSRPKKEIYAYIRHIKEVLMDNSELITPMELLASLLESEDEVLIDNEKKHQASNASMFAKRLFVYDYITTKIKNNEANNSFYEKQIRKIQDESENDFCLNKTERIQEAKAHFSENKAITTVIPLMKQEESLEYLDETFSTVKGHYDRINELLIDERYKRLLSDI